MHTSDLAERLFRYAMWWRIFYGTLRTALGLALLKLINVSFSEILYRVMNYELSEDPSDTLFRTIDGYLQAHPYTVTHFIAFYLIFWGVLDVVLSINLLREKIWAFPISLYLIALFVLYELYRFTHTHSLALLFIIGVDIVVFMLIRREYRLVKTRMALNDPDH